MSDPKLDEMTMRDLFALFAMQGLLSDPNLKRPWSVFADDAYDMADAMLKAREQ